MTNSFNQVCEFRQNYPINSYSSLRTNDPLLIDVINALNNFKKELEKKYLKFEGIDLKIDISKGAANFPHVAHVCILPPNQKVSNGIYVAICFDKFGKGAVIGCAESKTNPKGLNIKIRKSKRKIPVIDVDGGSAKTKYNNVFENPKDFYYSSIKHSDLENHINRSLSLCLYNLGLINDSKYLQTDDYLNSAIKENEIDYFNLQDISDDRKKIAIQIHARRGQKKFRKKLLDVYEGKCAVTGCEIIEILEAAHIYSFKGSETDKIPNGILLRSDIHTLFDLGLISINPQNYFVQISSKMVKDKYYSNLLSNVKITLPNRHEDYPSQDSLQYHFENIFIS
ncbi:HNH endonuclease [uncultured Chryseobacterium sp.]|uniref:HNH endonuclease n=1 Tax=uncultured Chryseobacterium sp. TaxID=259322 RepID=UPI002600149F|nr:HNH endonuclease [uncultured Chryseobacterium sp.]